MYFGRVFLFVIIISIFSFFLVACQQGDQTPQTAGEKPSVERTSVNTLTAKVTAVDYDARSLTIADEAGVSHTFNNIKPDFPLDKFEVGETITIESYRQELNYVVPEGEPIPEDQTFRALGGKEGADKNVTLIQAQDMTTTVKEVDVENRMVTLLMEDGTPMMLPVQDDVKNLENLKPGDKVVTQVTQVINFTSY
jgi:Cu/Ag efflux protein CusF